MTNLPIIVVVVLLSPFPDVWTVSDTFGDPSASVVVEESLGLELYNPAVMFPIGHSAVWSFELFGDNVRLEDLDFELDLVEFFPEID